MNDEELYKHDVNIGVLIDGKEISDPQYIVSVETSVAYRKLAEAQVVVRDGGLSDKDFGISDSDTFLIGKELTVLVGETKADQCIFKGVVEMQSISMDKKSSMLKITAKHQAYKMTLERKLRSFEDCTDQDVIESICSEYGIDVDIECPNVKHDRLVQYNCTDWDFINLRAEAMGLLLFTTPDGIVLSPPDTGADSSLNIVNGYNLHSLDIEMDARSAFNTHKAQAWNYAQQDADNVDAAGGKNDSPIGDLDSPELAGKNKNDVITHQMLASQENPDALTEWNKNLAMRADLSRITGTAKVWGFAPLQPGNIVSLENVGKRFNGKSIISSITHKVDREWTTIIGLGVDNVPYADLYDDIPAKRADAVISPANGMQVAKVKALEGDPLGEDRIYICLMGSEDTCLWARLATLDAGNQRGTVFCPEVGDEVVVGFINDNPNNAIVLGMLHSSSSPSPIEKTDDNHKKAIITREGLELLFDDENKSITLSTPGGNSVVLDDNDGGIFIEDSNGNKIVLDNSGITLETNKALNIKAKQDVNIEGNNTTVKANIQLKLNGQTGSEISSSGNTVVKGAIVNIN